MASSICKSLQCLISTLTQGGEGDHLFRLTCSVVLWGGRNTANKYPCRVWGLLTVSWPHWVCPPLTVFVLFQSTLLRLQAAGPGLYALPRSKTLRFRFSGTLQRCRLGWACVLCPSQVLAAQATRCLVSAVSPRWGVHRISSPIPATRFSGWLRARPSQVCYVSLLGSYSGCDPPSGCQPHRIPRTLG